MIRKFVFGVGVLTLIAVAVVVVTLLWQNRATFSAFGARAEELQGNARSERDAQRVEVVNEEPLEVTVAESPVNWTQVPLARYFKATTIDGVRWVLPLGTHNATDLSNGRYEAVESGPVGGSAGWCGSGQLDCPPWLGLYHAEVTGDVSAIMDIATRIQVSGDEDGRFHLMWRFNDALRDGTEKSLMDDYTTAASEGQLGLFVATSDPIMMPGTLTYLEEQYTFGYGCWDCLAHTSGVNVEVVALDDPSIGHMGPDTPTLGDSLWPAYVIPVPLPEDDPDFMIDLIVEFPKGTDVVLWFGRYDVPSQ